MLLVASAAARRLFEGDRCDAAPAGGGAGRSSSPRANGATLERLAHPP